MIVINYKNMNYGPRCLQRSRRTGYVVSGRILSWSGTGGGGGVAGTYVTRVRVLSESASMPLSMFW
jgi:hypothetical protein